VNRCGEISLRLGDSRLIRPRVNDEQNIAGIHPLPVLEANLRNAAHHLRPDLGVVDRVDAAREF
jgi:hypothetical protein